MTASTHNYTSYETEGEDVARKVFRMTMVGAVLFVSAAVVIGFFA